jgi:hypothetical protein
MQGQPPAEMLAQSATEFFSRSHSYIARFTLSERGLPTGFRVFDGDTEIIAATYVGSSQ